MTNQQEIKEKVKEAYSTEQINELLMNAKPIEKRINFEDFEGKETIIITAEPIEGPYNWGLILRSDYLDEDNTIVAAKIINFNFDKEEKEFTWYREGKVDEFMKSIGADSIKDIIGKKVTVKLVNKDGKVRLTF